MDNLAAVTQFLVALAGLLTAIRLVIHELKNGSTGDTNNQEDT